ncbi:hypothetical protein OWV82_007559 [Melia azedarach]|uniref:Uncharacterized protein n=1 Tax=Melia azedarach TaxID=155640 RepID=A0ACC1Y9F7_MELAZ|nr:hypothetical protein OWV82_007559 [Melia azedarach]
MDGLQILEVGAAVRVVAEDINGLLCHLADDGRAGCRSCNGRTGWRSCDGGARVRAATTTCGLEQWWRAGWSNGGVQVEVRRNNDHGSNRKAVGCRRFILFGVVVDLFYFGGCERRLLL